MIGLSVFAASVFGFRPAMAVIPDLVSMKPNSALAFCFGGLSLFLFTRPTKGAKRSQRKLSTGFAGAMAIVGMLTLWEYATGFNLGIDELLFRDHAGNSPTGRMAMITALSFVCLGLALVFLPSPKGHLGRTRSRAVSYSSRSSRLSAIFTGRFRSTIWAISALSRFIQRSLF